MPQKYTNFLSHLACKGYAEISKDVLLSVSDPKDSWTKVVLSVVKNINISLII